jgi:hypothetical protein
MTTSSVPATIAPEEARLDSIVVEIKGGLQEINDQIELQPNTDLPEARVVIDELQARKEQMLAKWLVLAAKVRDQISQIAQRNSDDDYRAIVPLVRKLDVWSEDEALRADADKRNQLKLVASAARDVQKQVRNELIGDREARAREQLALAEQVDDQPFVSIWPLLRAKMLWNEVASMVAGIEESPIELVDITRRIAELNSVIRDELIDNQKAEAKQAMPKLNERWSKATSASDIAEIEDSFAELRRILAVSAEIEVPQPLHDAYWNHEYDVFATKISASRVRGLLQRSLDPSSSIPKAWMELQEAQQLGRTLGPEINTELDSAEKALTARTVGQLEVHSTSFRATMQSQSYNDAQLELRQMSKLMPYASDSAEWKQRFNELQNEFDAISRHSPETQELKELLDYLDEVNEANNKFEALDLIAHHKSQIPKDLHKTPTNIRSDVVAAINRVISSLPTSDVPAFGALRRSYLEQIKRTIDESLQVS